MVLRSPVTLIYSGVYSAAYSDYQLRASVTRKAIILLTVVMSLVNKSAGTLHPIDMCYSPLRALRLSIPPHQ